MSGAGCYIFDIDGTLADCTHRRHYVEQKPKDWPAFFQAMEKDPPIWPLINLARRLQQSDHLIFCTGRPVLYYDTTVDWMSNYGLRAGGSNIFMRETGDYRPDYIIKAEMIEAIEDEGWEPAIIFDDRDSVVKMWREKGYKCCQVAEGNF